MTDLPEHDGKLKSDKEIISMPHQGYKGVNRDFSSHFPVTLETTCKFVSIFARLILGKVGVNRFTGPQWESDIR